MNNRPLAPKEQLVTESTQTVQTVQTVQTFLPPFERAPRGALDEIQELEALKMQHQAAQRLIVIPVEDILREGKNSYYQRKQKAFRLKICVGFVLFAVALLTFLLFTIGSDEVPDGSFEVENEIENDPGGAVDEINITVIPTIHPTWAPIIM